MNFRGLASRLRESASEVAQKIPTFDDMAAKDTYIHTDDTDDIYDFTAPRESSSRRTRQEKQERQNQELNIPKPEDNRNDNSSTNSNIQQEGQQIQARNEVDEMSSTGSGWSLLDKRRRQHSKHENPNNAITTSTIQNTQGSALWNQTSSSLFPLSPQASVRQEKPHQEEQSSSSFTAPQSESPLSTLTTTSKSKEMKKKNKQSSLPLLSVVTDALLDTKVVGSEAGSSQKAPANSRSGGNGIESENTSISMMTSDGVDDSDDEADSDQDDPILSMLQQSQPIKFQTKKKIKDAPSALKSRESSSVASSFLEEQTQQQEGGMISLGGTQDVRSLPNHEGGFRSGSVSSSSSILSNKDGRKRKGQSKNPNRFFDDLDKRLSRAASLDIDTGAPSETSSPQPKSSSRWGWVTSLASGKMGELLGRPPTQQQQQINGQANQPNGFNFLRTSTIVTRQQAGENRPPLARQPKTLHPLSSSPENDFSVTNSASVLAEDELAQLAQLKSQPMTNPVAVIWTFFDENRQFAFIGITMVLASLVYFWPRHGALYDPNST